MMTFALAGLALFAALCIGAALQRRQSYAVVLRGTDMPGGSDALAEPRSGDRPFAPDNGADGDLIVARRPDTPVS